MISEAFKNWLKEQYEKAEGVYDINVLFPEEQRTYSLRFFIWTWNVGKIEGDGVLVIDGKEFHIPKEIVGDKERLIFLKSMTINGNVGVTLDLTGEKELISLTKDSLGYFTENDGEIMLDCVNDGSEYVRFRIKNFDMSDVYVSITFKGMVITKK